MEEAAKEGYAHIQEKNYEAEFKERGIETIYKYGVAFDKKNCLYMTEMWNGKSVPVEVYFKTSILLMKNIRNING